MSNRSKLLAAAAACMVVLAGCASPEPAPSPAPAPASASAPQAAPAADANAWTARLAALKSALEAATQGLGVGIEQTADHQLHVVLPGDRSFDAGRAIIKRDMAAVLDKVAQALHSAPRARILIVGHTDATGSEPLNERLSQARANNARSYLFSRGVGADAVRTEGRGSSEPVADNDTAAGRAQNRRIEIFVRDRD
ncbi:OmpA family protein [Xenophilus sp. Marseille-Q4582]|uniref:OmpA family protein n=1 Tax=Xenophilus sp. Marseille-Q4582 TaxID=2866600 RepID=UPI001CE42AD5|nr:OmpA family protein [Xenophilus sp. Marseille-Q4582]